MILFNRDWALQGAKPDFTTKNKSFVEFVALLHAMGVKNCAFVLALHDQTLLGVDPHAEGLSKEIRSRIDNECRVNPWYALREVLRVPAGSGAPPEPIRANRAIVNMYWCFYARLTNIIIQPRQTGKSLGADCIKSEQMNFRSENTLINLFTKDEKLRAENIDRMKGILDCLPAWLNMRTKKDSDNTEGVTINALGNKLIAHLPRSDPRNAERVGRGFTSPIHFYDELPFQSWCSISYPASIAAMNDAIDRAKRNGADYGVVITTTAGKKDDRDGSFAYKLCCTACLWDERFYDVEDMEELHKVVRKASSDGTLTMYSAFNHRQLGYSDEWLRERMANSKGTPEEAERDFLCKWTSGTGMSPFTAQQSDKIRNSQRPCKWLNITPEGYVLRWYVDEEEVDSYMANSKFVLGLDTSEAAGGDDIGMYLIDAANMQVVFSAKVNETNIIDFAQWLASLLLKYRNIILVPERKSTGGSIVDYLLRILPAKGEDPFKRIFNMVAHDSDLDRERYEDIRVNGIRGDALVRYRKLFGYATTGYGATSRDKLYKDTLFNILKKIDCQFHDEDVINQLLGLIYKNGRIDHDTGGHDDLVVAMLLGYWFLLYGKNMSHYDIPASYIMSQMQDYTNMSAQERLLTHEQRQLRQRLKDLAETYSQERDEIRQVRLEMEMRNIERKLILESDEVNTVDQLIKKVKEERTRNRVERVRSASNTNPRLDPYQSAGRPQAQDTSRYARFLRPY